MFVGTLGIANELLIWIGEYLSIKDLYHFLLTSRQIPPLLTPRLHSLGLQDIHKLTALQWAAKFGHTPLVELAISNGADIDKQDRFFYKTPLHLAAESDHSDVIRVLMAHGARVNLKNYRYRTPLEVAVSVGAVNATKALLTPEDGVLSWESLSEHVMISGSTGRKESLAGAALDSNTKRYRITRILHHAARSTAEVMECLLENEEVRAGINDRNHSGETPLHRAVLSPKVVRVLLRHGADMEVRDQKGEMPAHRAASLGTAGIGSMMAFRDAGYDLNLRGLYGQTVLHTAAASFNAEKMIEFLVKRMGAGAIINAQDFGGRTPLALAATRTDRERITSLLVRYGANWEITDNWGCTPALKMCQSPFSRRLWDTRDAPSDYDPDERRESAADDAWDYDSDGDLKSESGGG